MPALTISPARPDEWAAALELVLRHLPENVRHVRAANALSLLESGDIPADGLLLARRGSDVLGALVCIPLKGASGLLWPPQVRPGTDAAPVYQALILRALGWLKGTGARLAQALVAPDELPLVKPLLVNGFRHVTRLLYLRHDLRELLPQAARASPGALRVETYSPTNDRLFRETLSLTYEDTLDCPELNGRRSIEEIVEGHRHQGKHRPELWWLAFAQDRPVGVVMLNELVGSDGWDLSYLGVVPGARRQGVGRALALRALREAHRAHQPQLILAVDVRNEPALQLYRKMGFSEGEEREVLLFFMSDLAEQGTSKGEDQRAASS